MTLSFAASAKRARAAIAASMLLSPAILAAHASPAPAAETPGKVLFILDASGSMWGEVKGEDKIVIAKQVMSDLVRQLPEGMEAGLEVYGHRSKGDCGDIEITVPPARGNHDAMIRQIQAITPKGMTPITGSLQMAAEALRASEQQASIVLVSDGKETCEADPCAAIEAIRAQGINVRVHVVGFDVKEEERKQLQCIADAGGGKYFSADDAGQLTAALAAVRQEVTEAPKEEPPAQQPTKKTVKLLPDTGTVKTVNGDSNVYLIDAQSNEQLGGMLGNGASEEVRTGTYKVRYGPKFVVAEIEVKAGETVTLDASTWLATVTTSNGLSNVYLVDPESGKDVEGILADASAAQVPAGTYRVRYGPDFEVDTIELRPGQTVHLDANKWLATVKTVNGMSNVYLVDPESGKNVAGILADGSAAQVPAGTYRVRYGPNFEVDTVELKPAQTITLDAHKWLGTVTVTTVKGSSLHLVDPATDKNVETIATDGLSVQVPAGKYKLKLGPKTEMGTIDVVAGEELVIE
jgi:hypothetical protein